MRTCPETAHLCNLVPCEIHCEKMKKQTVYFSFAGGSEMTEQSKTPRTDASSMTVSYAYIHARNERFVKESVCAEIEAENADLRRQVEDLTQRDDVTMTAFAKLENMFKHQVQRAEQAEAKLAAAQAEIAALREDAERYRYVRAKPHMLLHLSNKDFDAAIDAARKERQ